MNKYVDWKFDNISEFLKDGFSNDILEHLCSHNYKMKDLGAGGSIPTKMYWTTDLYSFGKCYRETLNLPYWLPFPFYGDHGADPEGELFNHEIYNTSKYHLCFYSERYNKIVTQGLKCPIRITHPWIMYKNLKAFKISERASGCIFFVPHTIDNVEINNFDIEIERALIELSQKYTRIVLCLHMHDVRKKVHEKLRKYNLPIFTVGESSSEFFVDRFYKFICNFEAAASTNSASQLYYCREFGLKYHLLSKSVIYNNKGHKELEIGEVIPSETRAAALKIDDYFYRQNSFQNNNDRDWLDQVLGLSESTILVKDKIHKIFYYELFRTPFKSMFCIFKGLAIRLYLNIKQIIRK